MAEDAVDPLPGAVIETGLSGLDAARRALAEARARHPAPPEAPPKASTPDTAWLEPAPRPAPVEVDEAGDPTDTLTSDGALLQMVQGQLREQLERALAERDARIAQLEADNGRLREELAVVAEAVSRAMRPAGP